jgi:hypothetical protein
MKRLQIWLVVLIGTMSSVLSGRGAGVTTPLFDNTAAMWKAVSNNEHVAQALAATLLYMDKIDAPALESQPESASSWARFGATEQKEKDSSTSLPVALASASAEAGVAAGQLIYAIMLYEGDRTAIDKNRAIQLATSACHSGATKTSATDTLYRFLLALTMEKGICDNGGMQTPESLYRESMAFPLSKYRLAQVLRATNEKNKMVEAYRLFSSCNEDGVSGSEEEMIVTRAKLAKASLLGLFSDSTYYFASASQRTTCWAISLIAGAIACILSWIVYPYTLAPIVHLVASVLEVLGARIMASLTLGFAVWAITFGVLCQKLVSI